MPSIAILDTLYGDFIKTCPVDPKATYDSELQRILNLSFGTYDAYRRGLELYGWSAIDVLANHQGLQELWARENGYKGSNILEAQMIKFQPDVILFQDMSLPYEGPTPKIMAAQCSCRLTRESSIRRFQLVLTSIPSHIEKFQRLGVRCEFLPLAFDPVVLQRMGPISGERSGCVFVGGVSNSGYWESGTKVLEVVAREIGDQFSWYGYGQEHLPKDSALRKAYRGTAFGLDQYRIMSKAAIVLNRHSDISGDYANNLRMYEATGVGAMLLTEDKKNLADYFGDGECVRYYNPPDAVRKIQTGLGERKHLSAAIAEAGQVRTLAQHTYSSRMKIVSDTLRSML